MPVFVGRKKELEALRRALDQARAGQGSCCVVSGEAGVGKSYLLSAFRRQATETGWRALEGRCFEQDLSVPYASLVFTLRNFFAHRTRSQLVESLGTAAREFARILPELNTEIDGFESSASQNPGTEKNRFFEILMRWLFGQADVTPLLLIVEELQWSDDGSLEFLLFLARRISAYPILLLFTYRIPHLRPGLVDLMANLDRDAGLLELRLDPLSHADSDQLMSLLLGREHPLPSAFVDQIYDLTGGNPFFIQEILNSLVATAEGGADPTQWQRNPSLDVRIPRSIKRLVQQRLRRLSRDALRTVNLAAISGRTFDFAFLQSLTGFRERRLLESIKELAYARQPGEKARALYSPRTAAEQFTRAIEAAEKIGDDTLWSLYRLRAEVFNVAGDLDRAQEDYEAARAAAQSLPSEDAEWQLLLDLAEFWAARDDTRVGDFAHQALALAQKLQRPTAAMD